MHSCNKAWRRARQVFASCAGYGAWGGCGPRGDFEGVPWQEGEEGGGGGGFGIRRPLRFLAHKLDLEENQVVQLARILDELKTERAQAEVDNRRTLAAFADALAGDTFDSAKAEDGGKLRLQSAERLRVAVLKALQQIHGVLGADQRARLAYLIRTGTLSL
jgi:Spy/CpxP family protein refolding chaperone